MKKYNRPSIVCKEMERNNIICTSPEIKFNGTEVDASIADAKDRGLLNVLNTDNSSSEEEEW